MLTGGDRVTNGCGDEIIRLVVSVVNGRFVVVENADVVYVGVFIVVGAVNLIKGREVVEMTGINGDFGDFVVTFGMYADVVPTKLFAKKKTNWILYLNKVVIYYM